jgi:energy-coupling factor transporter ATP-binding protein EcfA2
MRLRRLQIETFKGVTADIPWAPIIVLFGPNDAGKTNVLEAVGRLLTGGLAYSEEGPVRTDPSLNPNDSDWSESYVSRGLSYLELEGPTFQAAAPFERPILARLLTSADEEEFGGNSGLPDNPPEERMRFVLDDGEIGPLEGEPFEALVADLRARLIDYARNRCSDWRAARASFEILLDACLSSRRLLNDPEGLWLLSPSKDAWTTQIRSAADQVIELSDVWVGEVPIVDEFVEALRRDSEQRVRVLALGGDFARFRFWEVIRVGELSGHLELLDRVGDHLLHPPFKGLRSAQDETRVDSWFSHDGWALRHDIPGLCDYLSEQATRLAPEFVKRRYEIVIEPIPPQDWPAHDDRRLRVLLRDPSGREYDLRVAAAGLALWAGLAITEALRLDRNHWGPRWELIEDDDDVGDPNHDSVQETNDAEWPPHPVRTVYLFDEPERHLNPTAQREALAWLASRADEDTTVIFATHSPTFLEGTRAKLELMGLGEDELGQSFPVVVQEPPPRTEILQVWREQESEVTRTMRVTDNLLESARHDADRMGIGWGDYLLLARLVLVVEGLQDRLVLEHFYGREMGQERVLTLPLHGSHEAMSLAEFHFLSRLGKPIRVLLDEPPVPRKLEQALEEARRQTGADIQLAFLDMPDIWCALPEEHIERILRARYQCTFDGWDTLIEAYRHRSDQEKRTPFKTFVVRRLGLPHRFQSKPTDLLEELLLDMPNEPLIGSRLHREVEGILAAAS